MKTLLIPCMLIFPLAFSSCDGQNGNDAKIAVRDVPPAVTTALSKQYSDASEISWELEMDGVDTVYEATFSHQGKRMDAEFDKTGALAEED